MARKDSNDKTVERIEEDLKRSAADYADYAETRVSKLQQGYLRKYQPRRYASSAKVSRRPQFVSNERDLSMRLETPVKAVWSTGPEYAVKSAWITGPEPVVMAPLSTRRETGTPEIGTKTDASMGPEAEVRVSPSQEGIADPWVQAIY